MDEFQTPNFLFLGLSVRVKDFFYLEVFMLADIFQIMSFLKTAKTTWKGKWIWADYITPYRVSRPNRYGEKEGIKPFEKNVFCFIRKGFTISKRVKKAVINVSVDSRYKFFVNGKYIGRGIYRAEPFLWYYHSHEITDNIKEGPNILAFHARYYGEEFAYYTPAKGTKLDKLSGGKGGLIFELKIDYEDGTEEWVVSDDTCKIVINEGEKSDCPLKNDAIGRIEDYDTRKAPKNWNELEFDDSKWQKPLILNYPILATYHWPYDYLHEEIIHAEEIVAIRNNEDFRFSDPDAEEEEDPKNLDWNVAYMMESVGAQPYQVQNPEALLGKGGVCIIDPPCEPNSVVQIILKFPREMVGYPRIRIEGAAGTTVDIITSEIFNTDSSLAFNTWENKRGSRIFLRGGVQFFEQWDWEGYLYLIIALRDFNGQPVKIYDVSTNMTHFNFKKKGFFECSDAKLNELWKACAYTLKCCAIDGYLDCPSREQRTYLGDAYPEALLAFACFGEGGLTHKLIYDTAFGQREDGITYSFHPGDAREQTHIIPDYCLYWIQLVWEYFMYQGDDENFTMLKDLYPRILNAMKWFEKYLDPKTNLLTDLPYWIFVDWSTIDKNGAIAVINTQYADCCRIVNKIGRKIGEESYSLYYMKLAKKIERAIDTIFWDDNMKVYRDCIKGGKFGEQITQHTNGYLMLKEIVPADKRTALFQSIFERPEEEIKKQLWAYSKQIQSKYTKGIDVLVAQPFFMHHLNKLFAETDKIDLMFKYFEWGWLPMLEHGKTKTIWETWRPHGSQCHAWAATPAFDLSTHILGISPAEPGFKKIQIKPHFGPLKYAKGSFPSIRGEIFVEWMFLNETMVEFKIKIPKGTTSLFYPPKMNGKFPDNIKIPKEILDTESQFIVKY